MPAAFFIPETITFLRQLARHNDRGWFKANQARYEEHVRQPAQRFILAGAFEQIPTRPGSQGSEDRILIFEHG